MNTGARIREASSPQDALTILADALDAIWAEIQELKTSTTTAEPVWGEWEQPADDGRSTYEVDGDTTTVDLPPVSEEHKDLRRKFAKSIGLKGDNIEYYAKGGPLWLYLGDRDFVMGLTDQMRRMMVSDIAQTSPQEAREVARDILKDASPGTEAAMAAAEAALVADS